MFSWVRRRITYANMVVTLVLLFAMSGGAYAASKYLITSTKQIKPSVLKQLRSAGRAGPVGAVGAPGVAGPQGKEGPQGKTGEAGKEGPQGKTGEAGKEGSPWTLGGKLPSGQSLVGDWSVGAGEGFQLAGVSFGLPLESAPVPVYVTAGEATPPHCLGSVASPGAEPGYLCVFAEEEGKIVTEPIPGVHSPKICSNSGRLEGCALSGEPARADAGGFGITAYAESGGYAFGTWAVTAE